jgi:D-lactate dehydrogenase
MTPAVLEARAAARHAQFEPTEIGQLLSGILPQSQILTREIDRIMFASDASFYRLIPQAVVQPKTVDEVKALFEFSHKHGVPLTFRAGGTSLSGQAITDGILVDVGRYWRGARVLDNGKAIWVQPGLIGQQANNSLQLYRAKIGPDPASIAACRMGGILANNASGMCCGVVQNAYHTLRSTRFVLPSGTEIDTAQPDADEVFRRREPALTQGLLRLKQEIELNRGLYERIRAKYRMKNTTGYGLNAFIDFDRPAEIFSHLLIGSEGTLAFIAEAVLDTVPDFPVKYTGLLLFPNLHAACAAIVPLRDAGAAALELMDRASLRSVDNHPGVPPYIKELPDGAAGLLAEFQTPDESGRAENEKRAQAALQGLEFLHEPLFTSNPAEQADLWHLRKGMFPSVGAARATGTTVIIEDVAFPVEKLADATADLRRLLDEHGYTAAIIFGHAKDGNLHFVITQSFNTEAQIRQYRVFIDEMVRLVVNRYDGALKAEHGTGRNMAYRRVEADPRKSLRERLRVLRKQLRPVGVLEIAHPVRHSEVA